MNKGFFIAGTDTSVGKTVITCALMQALKQQGLKVNGMKPLASGCEKTAAGLRNEDALAIAAQCSSEIAYDTTNPYSFEPPIAPHIAAADAGITVDIETVREKYQLISEQSDVVLVEGVGGWQVPINASQTMADLAVSLKLTVILVVGLRLGCINHALQSAQAIRQSGLELAAWVANQVEEDMLEPENNIQAIDERLGAPLLGRIPYLQEVSSFDLAGLLDTEIISN